MSSDNPMRLASTSILLITVLACGLVSGSSAAATEAPQAKDVSVTLQSDGKHCVVREVKIPCTELAAHLRDTLKLPFETMVRLRAGRVASHQAVREVLIIIEKSGFSYPVAVPAEPKSSGSK